MQQPRVILIKHFSIHSNAHKVHNIPLKYKTVAIISISNNSILNTNVASLQE